MEAHPFINIKTRDPLLVTNLGSIFSVTIVPCQVPQIIILMDRQLPLHTLPLEALPVVPVLTLVGRAPRRLTLYQHQILLSTHLPASWAGPRKHHNTILAAYPDPTQPSRIRLSPVHLSDHPLYIRDPASTPTGARQEHTNITEASQGDLTGNNTLLPRLPPW